MSERQEQLPAEKNIECGDVPSFASPVPRLLPSEVASPTYATTLLSSQNKKGLLRSNLGIDLTPSPSKLLSRQPEVDSELVVSCTTPPIRLPDIENLILSNETYMDQNYSPTSPGSPFTPLQLPPPMLKPSILGQNISKEEVLDNFIGKFVGLAMKGFEKVDAESVEPNFTWQSRTFASFALEQRNKDTNNKMKYELVEATKSCHIIEGEGWYVHVNFIARAVDSPDQLFFAEVRHEDEIKVLTCFCCLQEHEQVGGLKTIETHEPPATLEMDLKHCYACSEIIAHPKNGASYKAGHIAFSGYYDAD
ncbi:uncharacterized protein [Lolium perenne]|uniref:uncharacterized protein isoform X2 n=1 Tax=Lolium perenne TaxID=4522 RepID=UPI0021F53880|nr:uncharacterized protein LOC127313643 isoform X2 [Lolium perenne]